MSTTMRLAADIAKLAAALATTANAANDLAPIGHGFTLLDAGAIFEPLPPIEYAIERVLPRGGLAILGGYSSSGKSWLALDAALSVATGSNWLGRFTTEHGVATILDKESGEYETRRRLQRLYAAKGLNDVATPKLELCSFPPVHFGDPSFAPRLRELAGGRALIVIDTLAAFSPGIDENAASMGEALNTIQVIAKESGCAMLVVAHEKKIGQATEIDDRERLRGSSAIFGAVDSVFSVQYRKDKPLLVAQTKARSGRAIDPFTASIVDVLGGTAVVTADVEREQDDTPEDRFDALCERVYAIIGKRPGCSGRHVRALANAAPTNVGAAIDQLLRDGRIVNTGNERNAQYRARPKPS